MQNLADEFENTVGSSITRSTPPFIAISARFHLSKRAGSPALYKITTHYSNSMTCQQFSLLSNRWYRCPLWNGLYSQIIPKILVLSSTKKVLLSLKFFISKLYITFNIIYLMIS